MQMHLNPLPVTAHCPPLLQGFGWQEFCGTIGVHCGPVNWGGHIQLKVPYPERIHLPPFEQGFGLQGLEGSRADSQLLPVN